MKKSSGDSFVFSCSVVSDSTAALLASLSFTVSWSLLRLISIELVMPSNHLTLCCPLLLPSLFPSITVFPREVSSLHQVASLGDGETRMTGLSSLVSEDTAEPQVGAHGTPGLCPEN